MKNKKYKKPSEFRLMDRIFFNRKPYEIRAIVPIQRGSKNSIIYNTFLRDDNGTLHEFPFNSEARFKLQN